LSSVKTTLDDPTPTFYGELLGNFFGKFVSGFVCDKIRKVKMSSLYDNKIRIFFELFCEENRRKTADGNFCYQ